MHLTSLCGRIGVFISQIFWQHCDVAQWKGKNCGTSLWAGRGAEEIWATGGKAADISWPISNMWQFHLCHTCLHKYVEHFWTMSLHVSTCAQKHFAYLCSPLITVHCWNSELLLHAVARWNFGNNWRKRGPRRHGSRITNRHTPQCASYYACGNRIWQCKSEYTSFHCNHHSESIVSLLAAGC